MEKMIIFYDGSCPLCVAEMKQLQQLNVRKRLMFEDILAVDFQHASQIFRSRKPATFYMVYCIRTLAS